MAARHEIKTAKASDDVGELKGARAKFQKIKVKLSERGPVWWGYRFPLLLCVPGEKHTQFEVAYSSYYAGEMNI